MKKAFNIFLLLTLLWSCATHQAPPPSFHIGSLPPSIVAKLSLEERILAEDAWNDLKQGKGTKAKKALSKLGTQSPVYYVGLGYVYYLLNELETSENYFKSALEEYPDLVLIHSGLAQIYLETGREDQAFAEYREVLKTESEHPWAKERYKSLKNRKIKEALTDAKAALDEGDTERGKEALLKALYYSPQFTEAHLTLAKIYKNENKIQNALVHLKAASSNEPENKGLLKNYADTLYQAAQYARSLGIYEQLYNLEPENKEISDRIDSLRDRLGIFELPSRYNSIPSSESISKEEISALLSVKFKGIVDDVTDKPPIIIDISTSWASKFILQMTSLGILDIYPNHTFQPKKIVTRAELAEILYRFTNYLEKKGFKFIQQIPPERIETSDVSSDNYYYKPIIHILSLNIMELTLERTFQPGQPVSGQDATKLLDIILALIK